MRTLRAGALLFLMVASGVGTLVGKSKPCHPTLATCPVRGCAKEDTPSALTNILKHNLNPVGEMRTLTFEDFAKLQDQVEKQFDGKFSTLTTPDRERLRNLKLRGAKVGEGQLVEIIGYIAAGPGDPHANNSGESVNCRLPRTANNDFHISLAPSADGTEYEGIVVEMIPQHRNKNWTVPRLRKVQRAHQMVRVRGQLFFDNHHVVNDDPDNVIKNQPKRMSLWEVHPVTEFDVCTLAKCEADSNGWKPLEDWKEGRTQ